MDNKHSIFKRLLPALWLRPESAVWYSHMLSKAIEFSANKFNGNSLDFGCMDGLNTYILMGGNLPFKFDVFDEVKTENKSYLKSSLEDDYYDLIRNDIHWEIERPSKKFTYGIDWKKSHIIKANRFSVHENIYEWQASQDFYFIDDNKLDFIWAPNIYWMKNVEEVFRIFEQKLNKFGRIVTIGPDISLPDQSLYLYREYYDEQWLRDIDRGRYENAKNNGRTIDEWIKIFASAGLQINRHDRFILNPLNFAYEIGFRPMFSSLIKMRELILDCGDDRYVEFKKNWVRRLELLSEPLLDDEYLSKISNKKLWHIFEVQKV